MLLKNRLLVYFFDAVIANNQSDITKAVELVQYRLKKYVVAGLKADAGDADDIVQTVLMNAISQIQERLIENPDKLGAYFIKSAKNQFISLKRKHHLEDLDENPAYFSNLTVEIEALIDQEKMMALTECVDTLKTENKSFIEFWLRFPDSKSEDIATHFNMNVNSVFTKKKRLIEILAKCVKEKLKF